MITTKLPIEILHLIFSYSSKTVSDFMGLKRVCKVFKAVIENSEQNENCIHLKVIMATSLLNESGKRITNVLYGRYFSLLKDNCKQCLIALQTATQNIGDEEDKEYINILISKSQSLMDYEKSAKSITDLIVNKFISPNVSLIIQKFKFEEMTTIIKLNKSFLLKKIADFDISFLTPLITEVDNSFEFLTKFFEITLLHTKSTTIQARLKNAQQNLLSNTQQESDEIVENRTNTSLKFMTCKKTLELACRCIRENVHGSYRVRLKNMLDSEVGTLEMSYKIAHEQNPLNRELKQKLDDEIRDLKNGMDYDKAADAIADAFMIEFLNIAIYETMQTFSLPELKEWHNFFTNETQLKYKELESVFDSQLVEIEAKLQPQISDIVYQNSSEEWQAILRPQADLEEEGSSDEESETETDKPN